MLNNRKFRIALALVIAVVLWLYVVGVVQPSSIKQVRGVPITMTHTDVLAERGLAMSGQSADSMDIEISGSVLSLNEISASDVTATVDLASATKGENEMSVVVRVPSGITVTDRSTNKVIVSVEAITTKTVDVNVVYTGTFAEGEEALTLHTSRAKIDVSGAESLISIVDSVRATIDANRVGEEATDISCQLQALNKEGTIVNGVLLSQESVTVNTVLSKSKSVELRIPTVDESADDAERVLTGPEQVTITGRADAVNKINRLTAEPVTLTDIASSREVPVIVNLPEGVALAANNQELKAEITVTNMIERSYTFTAKDIKLAGESKDLNYQFAEGTQVIVTLRGKRELINGITRSSIDISADVSALTAGENAQEAVVIADPGIDVTSIVCNPETVNVKVTAKAGD
ncbi:MAG: hypothetical protein K5707_02830 [Clostridia bacterium]|nr:hypothetical protein [Clostridia bacterium]